MEHGSFWYSVTINSANGVVPRARRFSLSVLQARAAQEAAALTSSACTASLTPTHSRLWQKAASPPQQMKPSLARQQLFLFLHKQTRLPFHQHLKFACQGFFKCYSSQGVQGTGDYSRYCFLFKMVHYLNKQRANQLEILPFQCLSSILFAYFQQVYFTDKYQISFTHNNNNGALKGQTGRCRNFFS